MNKREPLHRRSVSGPSGWLWLLTLLVGILGVKLIFVASYGFSVPILDQWDFEPPLYDSWDQGRLTATDLLARHNEHLLFTTRLWLLMLYVLNDGWNPLLQIAANALIHTAFWVLLAGVLMRALSERLWPGLTFMAFVIGVSPLGTINLLGGFQCQFYFSLLFQMLAVYMLLSARPMSGRWWLAWPVMGLAMLSLGNGLIGPGVAGLVMIIREARSRCLTGGETATSADTARGLGGGVLVLAACFAFYLTIPRLQGHASLQPESISQAIRGLAALLSVPYTGAMWWWLPLWLPTVVFAARYLRKGYRPHEIDWLLLALAGWVLAMTLATILARGRFQEGIPDYYLDMVSPGLLINAAILLRWLAASWQPQSSPSESTESGVQAPPVSAHDQGSISGASISTHTKMLAIVVCLWCLLVLAGLVMQSIASNKNMTGRAANMASMRQNTLGYLADGDRRWLFSNGLVPYFTDPKRMQDLLDDPTVRGLLPRDITPKGHPYTHSDRLDAPLEILLAGSWVLFVSSVVLFAFNTWRTYRPVRNMTQRQR